MPVLVARGTAAIHGAAMDYATVLLHGRLTWRRSGIALKKQLPD